MQAQETHAPEISLGVVSLETNLTPLLGDASRERRIRTEFLPQLVRKNMFEKDVTIKDYYIIDVKFVAIEVLLNSEL